VIEKTPQDQAIGLKLAFSLVFFFNFHNFYRGEILLIIPLKIPLAMYIFVSDAVLEHRFSEKVELRTFGRRIPFGLSGPGSQDSIHFCPSFHVHTCRMKPPTKMIALALAAFLG